MAGLGKSIKTFCLTFMSKCWRVKMFNKRKNYVPNLSIYQDYFTKKWYADNGKSDPFEYYGFAQLEDSGEYVMVRWLDATRFESLEDLMAAIYEYAYKKHLDDVKSRINSNKVDL